MSEVNILPMGQEEEAKSETETMLKNVNEAINAITMGGQSYKIGSRALTRADLKELRQMRNELMLQLQSEKPSSLIDNCYVGVFSGR